MDVRSGKKTYRNIFVRNMTTGLRHRFRFNPYKPNVFLCDTGKQRVTKSDASERGI